MHSCHSGPRYGLDIRDVDLVMHIGCPKTFRSYWQETGRCARDGRAGYSLVLCDKFTLSLKTTEKEVAQLILNKMRNAFDKKS